VSGSTPTLPAGGNRRAPEQVTSVRYRLEVRLTPADVGQRVVIRWRRRSPDGGEQIADVLGILEENDADSFAVRTSAGPRVVIPSTRALAGMWTPCVVVNAARSPGSPLRISASSARSGSGGTPSAYTGRPRQRRA
jgi:hypothetical protein